MAGTRRSENEMKRKNAQILNNPDSDPMERLRASLLSRGCNGLKSFGMRFKIMDDDGSRTISIQELQKACSELPNLDKKDATAIMKMIDKDGSGEIDFDEFLVAVRPPMSQARKGKIMQAFAKIDKTGDGVITVEDLKGVYNVSKHPKYLNGEKTEDELLGEFLVSFDTPNEADGQVTKEEFLNYYSGVSASIDQDCYFLLMMDNAWKLNEVKRKR